MEYGDATRDVLESILKTDVSEEDVSEDTEYDMQLNKRNTVLDGVQDRLRMIEHSIDVTDLNAVIKELNRRYKMIGIQEGVPRTVKEWLKNKVFPNPSPSYRENLFTLCFALDMSLPEVEAFFLKCYLTIPFNFKDRKDVTYYYCLRIGKTYSETKALLASVELLSFDDHVNDEVTSSIRSHLDSIQDDEVFMEFLKTHLYPREKQFQTARKEIDKLSALVAKMIDEEFSAEQSIMKSNEKRETQKRPIVNEKKEDEINYSGLFQRLYSFDIQEFYRDKKLSSDESFAKCTNLPKRFRESFPLDQQVIQYKNGVGSAEVYRKMLIILKFFHYFLQRNEDIKRTKGKTYGLEDRTLQEIRDDFDDFILETSACLMKCGFVSLYPRNPFDYVILNCVYNYHPINFFRDYLCDRMYGQE